MRRTFPAFAAALACAACTSPIFEPDIAGLQDIIHTYEAIPAIGTVLPGSVPDTNRDGNLDFDIREDRLTFMPHKSANSLDFTKGFVIRTRPEEHENEIYYRWDDGGTVRWMGSPAGYRDDEGVPSTWPVTLKNGTSLAAIVFYGGDVDTYIERLYADTMNEQCNFQPPPHWKSLSAEAQAVLSLGSPPIVVGVSVNADPLPGQDRLYALVRLAGNWWEVNAQLADSGLMSPVNTNPPGNYPLAFFGTPRHTAYYRDEWNQRSYAQWREWDGTWITWVWRAPPAVPDNIEQLPAIKHRIDTVISHVAGSTLLLSTEKQVARVYEYQGFTIAPILVAEFPLGELRYLGEMYTAVGGEWAWRLLFSRTVLTNNQVGFEIRSIKTADLITTFGL